METVMTNHRERKLIRQTLFNGRRAYERRLCRALQAWPSADALAAEMSEQGIERAISTWIRYRSGKQMPPAWLCEILMQRSIIQTRAQIKALEQRLEAIT